ncbi:hypothetical protein PSYAR_00732 [Pseudomonas syringae pv. aceris str. M302273]|nr:hypothetical protein PSYAR_00732 [Pseudomonas syringae pv. aceris str. M302273]
MDSGELRIRFRVFFSDTGQCSIGPSEVWLQSLDRIIPAALPLAVGKPVGDITSDKLLKICMEGQWHSYEYGCVFDQSRKGAAYLTLPAACPY